MNNSSRTSRLGLGTVQFGQRYGISNERGRVPKDDVELILRKAAHAGIGTLDTAAGYGEAEQILGSLASLTAPFRIVTKTIPLSNGLETVIARAKQSAATLGQRPVDLLLVHSAADLMSEGGAELWEALLRLRDEGLFRGIGISAYVADDPIKLARVFRPAAMQIPLSILDQRLLQSGALTGLKELGVEIHTRSLFLQGLLFLSADKLPPLLRHAADRLDLVRRELRLAGMSPLEGALGFASAQTSVDVGLVGISAPRELDEILDAAAKSAPAIDWSQFALSDPLVLTPSLW